MIDSHLHLWAHGDKPTHLRVDDIEQYWQAAQAKGLKEIVISEHLFRFCQAEHLVDALLEDDKEPLSLRAEMSKYWQDHQGADLDNYVEVLLEAQARGIPVLIGMEVDYYKGQMDRVGDLLSKYPFDLLLGSVHWLGSWMFDYIENPANMAEWDVRDVDEVWSLYAEAVTELAASGTCDVLAHPDLIKVAGKFSRDPQQSWDRMVAALSDSGMVAEVSSAGLHKPVAEQYPSPGFLMRLHQAAIPITTASDAHRVADVGRGVGELIETVKNAGYDRLSSFRRRRRVEILLRPMEDEHVESELF